MPSTSLTAAVIEMLSWAVCLMVPQVSGFHLNNYAIIILGGESFPVGLTFQKLIKEFDSVADR